MVEAELVPFHTFLLKIASRCNLDCDYCYVYRSVDQAWRDQPRLMSDVVARATVGRIREHLRRHDKKDVSIIFHGGEPLLGGIAHLERLLAIVRDGLRGSGASPSVGMQSNLVLFDDEIGRFLLRQSMSIGVSIDGPPRVNDRHRVDRRGRGSSERLESALRLLTTRYRHAFGGFLCVLDLASDPVEVLDYLASWAPPSIDFLLPLNNHERRPLGDEGDHGRWLVRAFDRWGELPNPPAVRTFRSIISMLCGGDTLVESFGLSPVDIVVVETDGSMEAVDSLRTTFQGASKLDLNVFDNSFDDAAAHLSVRSRQLGALALSETCRACALVDVCGGGYLPHRWSPERGFDNPSVYCGDLKLIITHISRTVHQQLAHLT